jgi:hypothetical protein
MGKVKAEPVANSTAQAELASPSLGVPVQKMFDGAFGNASASMAGFDDPSTIDISSSLLGSRQVVLPANEVPLSATAVAQG